MTFVFRCCDGRGCGKTYHLSCLDPSLEDVPLGVWHCLACIRKKMELGVHSVSEGLESIWDEREVEVLDGDSMGIRFYNSSFFPIYLNVDKCFTMLLSIVLEIIWIKF